MKAFLQHLFDNWKTSSPGVAAIVAGAAHIIFELKAHSLTENDCVITVMAVLGGIGMIATVSSKPTQAPAPPANPQSTTKVEDRN